MAKENTAKTSKEKKKKEIVKGKKEIRCFVLWKVSKRCLLFDEREWRVPWPMRGYCCIDE